MKGKTDYGLKAYMINGQNYIVIAESMSEAAKLWAEAGYDTEPEKVELIADYVILKKRVRKEKV